MRTRFIIVAVAVAAMANPAHAQRDVPRVDAKLTARDRTVQLALAVPATWHIGSGGTQRAGTFGLPTRLAWTVPDGWRVTRETWPTAVPHVQGTDTAFVYTGQFTVDVVLEPTTTTTTTPMPARGTVHVRVAYGLCRDEICMPGWVTATLP